MMRCRGCGYARGWRRSFDEERSTPRESSGVMLGATKKCCNQDEWSDLWQLSDVSSQSREM